MTALQMWLSRRLYYGWVVVAVTFLVLLVSSGVRATPGVLINPLEEDLGWGRAGISFGVSIGLLLYGFAGPFVGRLMDRTGPRRLMLIGLVVMAVSMAVSAAMQALWQFTLLWGVLTGIGTGIAAVVLGATVATRWFVRQRGLVIGLFGAAASAGQLVFVPLMMWLVVAIGWRGSIVVLAACTGALLIPTYLLMRDRPADPRAMPNGGQAAGGTQSTVAPARELMSLAVRTPAFWLLSGSFFVCGATSAGLIATHFIAHSIDNGISEVTAAQVLGLMGAMNFIGTTASGWLTDRHDPRKLLFCYYSLRGLSLFLLPFLTGTGFAGLAIFAIVFGLDYIATVPPTVTLCVDIFGRRNVGTIYGWVFAAHQLGAAVTAYLGGLSRDLLGDYQLAFVLGGMLALCGGLMAARISRLRAETPELQPA